MMNQTLKNSFLQLTVNSRGAELCSIYGANGTEYMWQADPRIWGRHAPILFPIVGKLANDCYLFAGKKYHLKQHGFARDMDFDLIENQHQALSYQLLSSPMTKKNYPFDFNLSLHYKLERNCIEIQYQVTNTGKGIMPFSIGAHPGFSLGWQAGDRIEDYFLEFEQQETVDTHLLNENHLLSTKTKRILKNENILPLHKNMFTNDALILLDVLSDKVTLRSRNSAQAVTVEFPGFPYLGIWAKPGASYVCIEPWYGYVDPESSNGVLIEKPGIIQLATEDCFSCTHRIIIEE